MDKGPKRDIIGEFEKAARKKELYFGISNHRARGINWFPDSDEFDTVDPKYASFYTPIDTENAYWDWPEALSTLTPAAIAAKKQIPISKVPCI
jgi:alpha-L-fucosidase